MATLKELEARVQAIETRMGKMAEWGKQVNAAIKQQPQAKQSSGGREWPETMEEVSISPVPHDYDGLFATYGFDKDADKMNVWAPNDLMDNPLHTEMDGGDDYGIIPVLTKANKASWIGFLLSSERKDITNKLEGSVNEGRVCSPIPFDNLRAVRGKATEIDIEAWHERRHQAEVAEIGEHEPADGDPF